MVKALPFQAHARSPAGQFFCKLLRQADRLGFPKGTAAAIWQMIERSPDAEARAFVFATAQIVTLLRSRQDSGAMDCYDAYCDQWLTPALIIAALEELARRSKVTGPQAARLQEQTLRWTRPSANIHAKFQIET